MLSTTHNRINKRKNKNTRRILGGTLGTLKGAIVGGTAAAVVGGTAAALGAVLSAPLSLGIVGGTMAAYGVKDRVNASRQKDFKLLRKLPHLTEGIVGTAFDAVGNIRSKLEKVANYTSTQIGRAFNGTSNFIEKKFSIKTQAQINNTQSNLTGNLNSTTHTPNLPEIQKIEGELNNLNQFADKWEAVVTDHQSNTTKPHQSLITMIEKFLNDTDQKLNSNDGIIDNIAKITTPEQAILAQKAGNLNTKLDNIKLILTTIKNIPPNITTPVPTPTSQNINNTQLPTHYNTGKYFSLDPIIVEKPNGRFELKGIGPQDTNITIKEKNTGIIGNIMTDTQGGFIFEFDEFRTKKNLTNKSFTLSYQDPQGITKSEPFNVILPPK